MCCLLFVVCIAVLCDVCCVLCVVCCVLAVVCCLLVEVRWFGVCCLLVVGVGCLVCVV